MQISLQRPDLEEFVAQQVTAGHFDSPEAVVEAGLAQLMLDTQSSELDDATLAAIDQGNAQIERGEAIDFRRFAEEMWGKYLCVQRGSRRRPRSFE